MLRLSVALLPTLRSAMRPRRDLVIENLALRQQLATLAIVRPDTVVRWHRAGFRIYWNWLSRRGKRSGRPLLPREVHALIRRMATDNSWGAPRIHGELLCLGFDVSERFVATVRRELLDHVIVLNERHLRRLLESFIGYCHQDRTHLGLGKDSPRGRRVERRLDSASAVVGLPRVGGLHQRYAWRQAA